MIQAEITKRTVMRRCKSVTFWRNKPVRCMADEGHYSAHYNGKLVWDNLRGLPLYKQHALLHNKSKAWCVALVIGFSILCAVILGLIIHFKP